MRADIHDHSFPESTLVCSRSTSQIGRAPWLRWALTFPVQSLGQVLVIPLPGWSTPAVITYAYCNADADAPAEEFRATCNEAFACRSVSLGQDPETAAYLLALRRQGLTYAQVFDRYRADRPDWFPWPADDPEYELKRDEAIDAIKKTVGRLKAKLKESADRMDDSRSE